MVLRVSPRRKARDISRRTIIPLVDSHVRPEPQLRGHAGSRGRCSIKNLLALLLFASSLLFAQDRFDGTWEMKMDTLRFSRAPEEYLLNEGMYHCLSCVPKVDVKADGNDQKVTRNPRFDTISVRVVGPSSVEFSYKKDGNPLLPAPKLCRQTEIRRWKSSPRRRHPSGLLGARCLRGRARGQLARTHSPARGKCGQLRTSLALARLPLISAPKTG